MGFVGGEENKNAAENGVSGSEFSLGKTKYKRMESEAVETEEDVPLTKENRNSRIYVFACAIFASLSSVLLGYGWYLNLIFNTIYMFSA